MCYCTPSIRTPYCQNCSSYMRTEIESLRERIKGFVDHNHQLSVQMADISIANMRANNFINDLGTVLRDSETPRDEAMEMIRNWYSEGGE